MVIAETVLYLAVVFLCILYFIKNRSAFYKGDLIEEYREIADGPWMQKSSSIPVILFIFLMFILAACLTYLWSVLKTSLVLSEPDSLYFGSSWGISAIVFLFISIPLTSLLFERIIYKTGRFRFSALGLAIILIIGFPFVILNTDCYTRVGNDSISVNRYFGFSQKEYSIPEDIDHGEFELSTKSARLDFTFYYYVFFKDNSSIEVLNQDLFGSGKVVLLNETLRKNGVTIFGTPISESQWETLEKDYDRDLVSSVKKIYEKE